MRTRPLCGDRILPPQKKVPNHRFVVAFEEPDCYFIRVPLR